MFWVLQLATRPARGHMFEETGLPGGLPPPRPPGPGHLRPPDEEIVTAELSPENYLNNFRIEGFHANRNADFLTHTMLLYNGVNVQRYHATLYHTTLPRNVSIQRHVPGN